MFEILKLPLKLGTNGRLFQIRQSRVDQVPGPETKGNQSGQGKRCKETKSQKRSKIKFSKISPYRTTAKRPIT